MKRFIAKMLVFLFCVLLSGCFENSIWLPDSSGIIYFQRNMALAHFDIATKRKKEIAQFDWIAAEDVEPFARPGVNPNGNRIAVAKHTFSSKKETVEILFYDLRSGNLIETSKLLSLPGHPKFDSNPESNVGRVHWASDDRHFLVAVWAESAPEDSDSEADTEEIFHSLIYNRIEKSWKKVDGFVEIEEALVGLVSPLTPDGKGFLANPYLEDTTITYPPTLPEFYFIDWTGRSVQFSQSKSVKEKLIPNMAENKTTTSHFYSRWENGKLTITDSNDDWQTILDPKALLVDYRRNTELSALREHVKSFDLSGAIPLKSGTLLQWKEKTAPSTTLEIVQGVHEGEAGWKWGPPKELMTVAYLFDLVPSPDRKYWLVYCDENEKHQGTRLFLSANGELVGQLRYKPVKKN